MGAWTKAHDVSPVKQQQRRSFELPEPDILLELGGGTTKGTVQTASTRSAPPAALQKLKKARAATQALVALAVPKRKGKVMTLALNSSALQSAISRKQGPSSPVFVKKSTRQGKKLLKLH